MSGRRQNTSTLVSREYHNVPDSCTQALKLLLQKLPENKQGGSTTAPDARILKGLLNGPRRLET